MACTDIGKVSMDDIVDDPIIERRRVRSSSWAIGLTVCVGCLTIGTPAFADFVDTTTSSTAATTDTTVTDDPLHVYFPNFVDNGTNTPTSPIQQILVSL
jgi:hypothetical protein